MKALRRRYSGKPSSRRALAASRVLYQAPEVAGLPQEHPTDERWCTPDDFVKVKLRVGGYLATTHEPTQLSS